MLQYSKWCYRISCSVPLWHAVLQDSKNLSQAQTKTSFEPNSNLLKFRFISYLIEVKHNETQSFKELLSLGNEVIEQNQRNSNDEILSKKNNNSKNINKNQFQLSLGERQVVRSLYQRSIISFRYKQEVHLKGKKHEHSMLFSIMSFDEKMSICQNILKNCIEDKSIIIKNLSLDEVDINLLFKEGFQLRQKREELKAMLVELINLNSSSSQLEELCQFFDETINFDCSLAKNLKKKKDREGECNNSKSRQIYLIMQKFYSPDSAVAFVSLMNEPGKIVKTSHNFSAVVPNFFSRENYVVGSHINCMIPQYLHASHNAILNEFGQHEIMQRALRDIPLVIGSDKNGWSVPYQLKIQTYHDLQKQELGVCTWIRNNTLSTQLAHSAYESLFISADLQKNGKIINISEQFFQEILHKNFHQRDIQSISLFSMIPALQGILKNYNTQCTQNSHSNIVGEIYETLLVQITPQQKQTNWMQTPHRQNLIENISHKHLYWIQIEVNIIKNKYMHVLQLEIKNMRHLQAHSNDNPSIDNKYALHYKIEGLKSLCLQLLTLCDWTQEEIAPQFLDLNYEENSPFPISSSPTRDYKVLFLNKQRSSLSNTYNQIYSNSQIQNMRTLSFQERSVSCEKDNELIHLQQINQKSQEEKFSINNLSQNISHLQLDADQRQAQQQILKYTSISNLLELPSINDISPIAYNNNQYMSFNNITNKQGDGTLKSINSYPTRFPNRNSCSGDNTSSIKMNSKEQFSDQKNLKLKSAQNKSQSFRQIVDNEYEGSVNSSNKTILSQLKQQFIQK